MEERIIEKDEGRKITVKKTAAGGIADAVEEGTAVSEEPEEDVVVELPEGVEEEYDEDLVGLTPTQLEKALEARARAEEQARAERDQLLTMAEEALAKGDYKKAETAYSQALVYDKECLAAKQGVWVSLTRNFQDAGVFYELKKAKKFAEQEDEVKEFVLSRVGEELREERKKCAAEEEPLCAKVAEARKIRRSVFEDNRSYYRKCVWIWLAIAVLFAVGAGVSALFIVRTMSYLPVILTSVFGGLCFLSLIVTLVFCHKLYVAAKFCRDNEKLSSTEDGKRLAYLQNRLKCLDLVLGR